jgi:D-3-phosphoglycerate dehydrogenase
MKMAVLSHTTPKEISFPKHRIRFLMLENIHAGADAMVKDQGFSLETLRSALGEDDLIERIADVHELGIRSKTRITPRVLQAAKRLLCIGCYCI